METATKTIKNFGTEAAESPFKRVVQKIAESTGDLIGNKIADKITYTGKPKEFQQINQLNDMNEKKSIEICIPPEKIQKIIGGLRLASACIKMDYQEIINLLDTTPDIMPKFNAKKWLEAHDQSGGTSNTNKQIRFKVKYC